jgi:hypothetical protein
MTLPLTAYERFVARVRLADPMPGRWTVTRVAERLFPGQAKFISLSHTSKWGLTDRQWDLLAQELELPKPEVPASDRA